MELSKTISFVATIVIINLAVGKSCFNLLGDSDMVKKFYECCGLERKKGGLISKTVRNIANDHPDCVKELISAVDKGGTYYERCKKISLDEFPYWCKKVHTSTKYTVTDAFLLSLSNDELPWDKKMREKMFSIIYDGKYKAFNRPIRVEALFYDNKSSPKFWNDFFRLVSQDDRYMLACMSYMSECVTYFTLYFERKSYLDCSEEDVQAIIGSMMDYPLKDKGIVVQKMSPRAMIDKAEVNKRMHNGGKGTDGLLDQLCTRSGSVKYFFPNWANGLLKSFFYHTVPFKWPFEMFNAVLKSDVKQVAKFASTNDPYKISKDAWDFPAILNLIDFTCIESEYDEENELYSYKLISYNTDASIKELYEITNLSHDYFQLSSKMIQELLKYNYLDKFTNKLGVTKQQKERRKATSHMVAIMNQLKSYERKPGDDDTITPKKNFVTPDMITLDPHKIGVRILITFGILFTKSTQKLNEKDFNLILRSIKEINSKIPTDSKEAQQHVITKDNSGVNDPKSLASIRKHYGYEPIYNFALKKDENFKTWGKIAFVAVHAICIRYDQGLIKEGQIKDEFIKCIDDVKSKDKKDSYCSLFKTNPYFGEFDNIIVNEYSVKP